MCFRGADAVGYYRAAVNHRDEARREGNEGGEDEDEDEEEPPFADPETVDISPARWERLCSHHLQPLRYCLESVRGEFLNVARVFKLLSPGLLDTLAVEDVKWSSATAAGGGTDRSAALVSKTPVKNSYRMKPGRRKSRGSVIRTAATIEKSKTMKKPVKKKGGGVGGLGKGSNPLDSFFPFDPYLLRRSHDFIDPYYRDWQGSVEDEDNANMEHDGGIDAEPIDAEQSASHDEEDRSHSDSSDDDTDDDPDSGDEYGDQDGRHMPMSVTPVGSMLGDAKGTPLSPSEMHNAFEQEIRRSRAQSIGGGSW